MTRPISEERLEQLATIAPTIGLNAESAAELRALAGELLLRRNEVRLLEIRSAESSGDSKLIRLHAQLEPATDAITYTLRRFQTDAEFAYHMWHTETLDRLMRAYAALKRQDVAEIRRRLEAAAMKLPQARCAADKEYIDGGCHV